MCQRGGGAGSLHSSYGVPPGAPIYALIGEDGHFEWHYESQCHSYLDFDGGLQVPI